MNKIWSDKSWDDYLYWQTQDKKTIKRINTLIKDIDRNGVSEGIGKPEPLKYLPGWSRRIDDTNRLVYDIVDGKLWIISCRGHLGPIFFKEKYGVSFLLSLSAQIQQDLGTL